MLDRSRKTRIVFIPIASSSDLALCSPHLGRGVLKEGEVEIIWACTSTHQHQHNASVNRHHNTLCLFCLEYVGNTYRLEGGSNWGVRDQDHLNTGQSW